MSENKPVSTTVLARNLSVILLFFAFYEISRIVYLALNITRDQFFTLLDRLVIDTATLAILAYTSYFAETYSPVKLNITNNLPFNRLCAMVSSIFPLVTAVYLPAPLIILLFPSLPISPKYVLGIAVVLSFVLFLLAKKYMYIPWQTTSVSIDQSTNLTEQPITNTTNSFWQKKTLYYVSKRILNILNPIWFYLIIVSNMQIFAFCCGRNGCRNAIETYKYTPLPLLLVNPIFYSTVLCMVMFITITAYALIVHTANGEKPSKVLISFFSLLLSILLFFYVLADTCTVQHGINWMTIFDDFKKLDSAAICFLLSIILLAFVLFFIILQVLGAVILSAKDKNSAGKLPSLKTNGKFLTIVILTIVISSMLCYYAYNNGKKANNLQCSAHNDICLCNQKVLQNEAEY